MSNAEILTPPIQANDSEMEAKPPTRLSLPFVYLSNGSRGIIRFSVTDRWEHLILMVSFGLLAVTGLAQKFNDFPLSLTVIKLMGGIETARAIHRISAGVMVALTVFHLFHVIYKIFVRRSGLPMLPHPKDLTHLWHLIGYFFGKRERPHYGRYTIEEKFEYWALIWGTIVMIVTGLIMWFPEQVSHFVTGEVVIVARIVHGGEALLAALTIVTWHIYHTMIKTQNMSIFTGVMPEEEMEHEHPAELEDLLTEMAQREARERAEKQEQLLHIAKAIFKVSDAETLQAITATITAQQKEEKQKQLQAENQDNQGALEPNLVEASNGSEPPDKTSIDEGNNHTTTSLSDKSHNEEMEPKGQEE